MQAVLTLILALGLAGGTAAFADSGKDKRPMGEETGKAETAKTTKPAPAAATATPTAKTGTAANTVDPSAALANEIKRLDDRIAEQAKQIETQRKAIEEQQQQIREMEKRVVNTASAPAASAMPAPGPSVAAYPATTAPTAPAAAPTGPARAAQGEENPPLSFKIGFADFTPGGFMDFTNFFRSTNTGSGIGTGFGSIPFNHASPTGLLTEDHFSAQNSRLSLKVDSNVGASKVTGYVEADFLGNAASNLFVTSNSDTLRVRLYFVDVRRGKWDFLGGQDWSMMTPNRRGIGYMPGDIFYTQNMDTNYQVGLIWSRQTQFRAVYHASDNWTLGFSLENPEQYTGGLVTFPSAFNTIQVDDAGGNSKAANVHPDFIAKLAYDTAIGGKQFHIEASGLYRTFRISSGTTTSSNRAASGGAGSLNMNLELVKNFRLIADSFWSDGGGRYIFGLGPDFIVRPGTSGILTPVPLHGGAGIGGFEWQVVPNTMLYGYYGAAYFGRRFATVTTPSGPAFVGYGYPGSSASQNRAIQEGTVGIIQTLWKNRNYGDLKIITQASYLVRSPWALGGAPANAKNAHLGMGYVDLRYDLP